MLRIPTRFPDKIWLYTFKDGILLNKSQPVCMNLYYSEKYNEFLYVLINRKGYLREQTAYYTADIERLKLHYRCDFKNTSEWHSFFLNKLQSRSYMDFSGYNHALNVSTLIYRDCLNEYQIIIPDSQDLLFDLIDDNVIFETATDSGFFSEKAWDEYTKEYTGGLYLSIADFYMKEKHTTTYSDFLHFLNNIRINEYCIRAEECDKCLLINLGYNYVPFDFERIGFGNTYSDDCDKYKQYYNPMYNYITIKDRIKDVLKSDIYGFMEYTMIDVPKFADSNDIISEIGLSNELIDMNKMQRDILYQSIKKYQFNIDIFPKYFGFRNKDEIEKIYHTITKHKKYAYNWFSERGAIIWTPEFEK